MKVADVYQVLSLVVFLLTAFVSDAAELRVMTFNLWHGGDAGRQPLSQSAEVIRTAKADIVGLQETHGLERDGQRPDNGAKLAELLGWHYFNQGGSPGILSRFPIVTNTPAGHGVAIRLPSGREIRMFNVHLMHAPYQPYQLLDIPYANAPFIKTAEEAVAEAIKARGAEVDRLLAELRPAVTGGQSVFLTGDFNEPSHLDWTDRAAIAGRCPLPVEWPSSRAVMGVGLKDAYRTVHPDALAEPGHTWTPTTQPDDPKDRHDRIDFVFVAGDGVTVTNCEIVGEKPGVADRVVQPFPSDHRAVVATVRIP